MRTTLCLRLGIDAPNAGSKLLDWSIAVGEWYKENIDLLLNASKLKAIQFVQLFNKKIMICCLLRQNRKPFNLYSCSTLQVKTWFVMHPWTCIYLTCWPQQGSRREIRQKSATLTTLANHAFQNYAPSYRTVCHPIFTRLQYSITQTNVKNFSV